MLKLKGSHNYQMEYCMSKKTVDEKEQELLSVIESAQKKLSSLQKKQKVELGSLAYKYGLHQADKEMLASAFKKIAKEMQLGPK